MQSREAIYPRAQQGKRSKKSQSRRKSFPWLMLLLPAVLWLGYREIRSYFRQPQAVLVLGGAPEREVFAAEFAREHPQISVWISSGSNPEYTEWAFAEAGIAPNRVIIDREAVDTVTNFTTLVDKFKAEGIDSVYLITSDYHMRRAQVIGEIVLGSRGIDFKPVSVPSGQSPESLEKAVRDGARAILWVATGRTGSRLSQLLNTSESPEPAVNNFP
ncbi:YdcF family protein [Trichocoleus sp. FACHB-46]|uniref:YdcF family protein n=1 Tax=Trichocoleus desertorum GB2-A4 TaxID=2933944 RepID=A0ABV0JDK6_9CYAN|nr:YdcF family protein [Trichocoleus sp. FACHB-46]MBD1861268.1 YdcF family protein [Trichocoleus sp. FACHB-46]